MKKPWPDIADKTLDAVYTALRYIIRTRDSDLSDWNNLKNTFIAGRTVQRVVPTSSTDVLPTDSVGDFLVNDTYAYYLVLSGGTPVWRRVAVGVF